MVDNITSNLKMHRSVIITTEGNGSLNREVGHSSNLLVESQQMNQRKICTDKLYVTTYVTARTSTQTWTTQHKGSQ